MAKIDVTQISGYAEMSAEDKVKALEAFEYSDNASEITKLKNLISKTNTEAKEWKDKYNSKLSESEQKDESEKEEREKLQKELEGLRRDKIISEHTAELCGLGYGRDLAVATATAYVDGDMKTVFANHKTFQAEHDKAYKEELLKSTPIPGGGDGNGAVSANYTQLAAEAQAAGNYSEAAYYLRLSQSSN